MIAVADRPTTAIPPFSAVESPSSAVDSTDSLPIPADMLDGGEVVLEAIKPSLWFVLFDSIRWIAFGAVLFVLGATQTLELPGLAPLALIQLAFLLILARLGVGMLRWVSRFYVLTNRRVMRVRGVFRADILSCPLLKIRNTRVTVGPHEKIANLGTIIFITNDMPEADLNWYQIAKVDEVHSRVRRAIERAIDNQPHL